MALVTWLILTNQGALFQQCIDNLFAALCPGRTAWHLFHKRRKTKNDFKSLFVSNLCKTLIWTILVTNLLKDFNKQASDFEL